VGETGAGVGVAGAGVGEAGAGVGETGAGVGGAAPAAVQMFSAMPLVIQDV